MAHSTQVHVHRSFTWSVQVHLLRRVTWVWTAHVHEADKVTWAWGICPCQSQFKIGLEQTSACITLHVMSMKRTCVWLAHSVSNARTRVTPHWHWHRLRVHVSLIWHRERQRMLYTRYHVLKACPCMSRTFSTGIARMQECKEYGTIFVERGTACDKPLGTCTVWSRARHEQFTMCVDLSLKPHTVCSKGTACLCMSLTVWNVRKSNRACHAQPKRSKRAVHRSPVDNRRFHQSPLATSIVQCDTRSVYVHAPTTCASTFTFLKQSWIQFSTSYTHSPAICRWQ